ncbi:MULTISPECIES: HPP family protein [unclassified Variovorax]|uniref:HPP family protein n=1 Tax=unclassified Variovorax TaxID=663243 RepID=UPI001316C748|nr:MULTISPECIES: HPP family protein [unclassified Variovorax]VTU16014.1 putative manganese-dependent inorganic pyrophosphatase [Variovorax sp. SRS16]VTU24224.1 putative manganese-dependent inorganic pyrophosphatase [Variovorax sp. PBL-E5]
MRLERLPAAARAWLPGRTAINTRERLRAIAGAGLGLLLTALVCRALAQPSIDSAWLIAPLGASAVLVFALPASPLAQPWSVIGGNAVAALIGIACVRWIPDPAWAGALATALAIAAMLALRCLHPPGGAVALLAVLAHATQFRFALFPVLANSLLLVLVGVVYNSLTGRRYPHVQLSPRPAAGNAPFSSADIDAVLARYNQVLDISRDDLELLIRETELEAWRRRLGTVRCADIMSHDPVSVAIATPLQEAWALMHARHIKALPVIDRSRQVVGIVTQADFFRQIDLTHHEGFGGRLRDFIRATRSALSNKPQVVGEIMTRQVRVASEDRPMAELVPIFSESGHHHIPIIDEARRLRGMVTESDFVRALYRVVGPQG